MSHLTGKKVAMVVAPQFEDSEAVEPKQYLEEHGATVTLVGIESGKVEGKKGASLSVDKTFEDVSVNDFDALVIPGGGSPENLRIHDPAVNFTKAFVESNKPVASICHGAQLLISAGVLKNRTVTCVAKIRDDVMNAGATYKDQEVLIDGNLISSRVPKDIPAFNKAIDEALAGVPVGD